MTAFSETKADAVVMAIDVLAAIRARQLIFTSVMVDEVNARMCEEDAKEALDLLKRSLMMENDYDSTK